MNEIPVTKTSFPRNLLGDSPHASFMLLNLRDPDTVNGGGNDPGNVAECGQYRINQYCYTQVFIVEFKSGENGCHGDESSHIQIGHYGLDTENGVGTRRWKDVSPLGVKRGPSSR